MKATISITANEEILNICRDKCFERGMKISELSEQCYRSYLQNCKTRKVVVLDLQDLKDIFLEVDKIQSENNSENITELRNKLLKFI